VDIVQAGAIIDRAKSDIDALRQDIDDTNHDWFSAADDLAEKSGTEGPCMPRICGRQTLRDNVTTDTPDSYFKRSLTIPFLDHLSAEIETLFSDTAKKAAKGLNLMPNITIFSCKFPFSVAVFLQSIDKLHADPPPLLRHWPLVLKYSRY